MKKELILVASALAVLAACNRMEQEQVQPQEQNQLAEIPVGFDVYTQRGVSTKAGYAGDVENSSLKDAGKANGFGVFAFYTDNNTYDQQFLPNFMYNEHVTYSTDKWIYTPIKFWPNEYGNRAESDDSDKISFFAYAPWVNVVPSTGKIVGSAEEAKWGINSLSRNSATGDPMVKYLVDFDPVHSVDLVWGVANNDSWQEINGGSAKTITAGKPWLDIERPAQIQQPVKFTFKHALAKLRVLIDADPDIQNHDVTNDFPDATNKTRVYVRSVTFEGFATKGALNLNNTTADKALWMDYNNTANDLMTGEEYTIYDGRKDGKEGTPGGVASNEKQLGLNPNLVQSTIWGADDEPEGVKYTFQNLFRKWDSTNEKYVAAGENDFVYVIPTGDNVRVTIVYDVETADAKLAARLSDGQTSGSSVENRITKSITFADASGAFENGKAYTIKLHLGMNSVKFDADVTAWDEQEEINVELPSNVVAYAAANPQTEVAVTVPAGATSFEFAITGLNASENVSSAGVAGSISSASANRADASGVAVQTVAITANNSVLKVEAAPITWTGASSTKAVKLTITQAPHAIELSATGTSGESAITLSSGATDAWSNLATTDGIVITRNGGALTKVDSTPTTGQFSFDTANGKVTLGEALVSGEIFVITVKVTADNAESETITIKIS